MRTSIFWLRRDLRLADNPALAAALSSSERVAPVYIHAPQEESPWLPGSASEWWRHHSLSSLQERIGRLGSRLIIRQGPSKESLLTLARESNAEAIHWNRLYEPALIEKWLQANWHGCKLGALPPLSLSLLRRYAPRNDEVRSVRALLVVSTPHPRTIP